MLSIIIPTLNEEAGVAPLLEEISSSLLNSKISFEVVFVDDGSTDQTASRIQNLKSKFNFPVTIIQRNEKGLAGAVLRGISESSEEVVCVMDADLSHPPELISPLYKEILDGADIAIGSRRVSGGGVEKWPLHRKFFSYVSSLCALPISKGVKDPLSGFFCVKKSVLTEINSAVPGYKILLEILVKSKLSKIVEVPYVFRNRNVGKSKLNNRIAIQYFRHLFSLYLYTFKNVLHSIQNAVEY